MKIIILFCAALELIYLIFSFLLGEAYGQWSIIGEVIRTGLRVIFIVFYGYFYQKYFYKTNQPFNAKKILSPQFLAAIVVFILFAVVYTNAENETLFWQIVFVISGITAGLREELFYRGIIQNSLQTKFDNKTALLSATLIFTLSHLQYIYHGQTKGLMLIAFAGIIFGSIFIYTGSIVFTAIIHGLYDAVLCINIIPFRLSNGIVIPIMFLIMLAFVIISNKKLYTSQIADNTDDSKPDKLSLG